MASDKAPPRFAIGQRVVCNTGEWTPGVITKHHYREKKWPEGKIVPYQVKLDDGRLIFAPIDDDRVIRASEAEPPPPPPEEIPDSEKLPVTVLTGFLGAGKTTLVNYILTQNHGKKIAVIENEFGAVNIDEDLVQENMQVNEDIVSMANGCVCCTVRDDLVKALHEMAKRKDKLDYVLIETTGLADPAPVCLTFQGDEEVARNFRVDGIVCMVDVQHIEQHLDEVKAEGTVNEAVQQVAFADKILINKVDLATPEQIQAVKGRVHSINSFAELIESQKSEVPLDKILELGSFSLERIEDLSEWVEDDGKAEVCMDPECTLEHGEGGEHGAAHGDGHGHGDHGHGDRAMGAEGHDSHGHGGGHGGAAQGHGHGPVLCEETTKKKLAKNHDLSGVASVGLTLAGPLDPHKFNSFMSRLLQANARDIYRSKGVVCLQGEGNTKFVFQGVHEQVMFSPAKSKWEVDPEERVNKLVFIGRNLDRASLTEQFEACRFA